MDFLLIWLVVAMVASVVGWGRERSEHNKSREHWYEEFRKNFTDGMKQGREETDRSWMDKFSPMEKQGFFTRRKSCDRCGDTNIIPVLAKMRFEDEYECQGLITKGDRIEVKCICLKCATKNKTEIVKWS